jgi:hypothetical protein
MNKRRHELEENELASFLGKKIGAARENPDDVKKWAVPILLGIIAICGVWIAVYAVRTMSRPAPGSWLPLMVAYTMSETPEATRAQLKNIAETPDEPAALWAQQMRADSYLQQGSSQLFAATRKERDEGLELLKSAQEGFAKVRTEATDRGQDSLLVRRASFGEAQAWEALAEPEKAIAIYADLAENAADSAVGEASKKKLMFLARKSDKGQWIVREDVANFMKTYETFVPTPPPTPGPLGTTPPAVDPAADVKNLTPAPDLSFPGMEEFLLPGGAGTEDPAGGSFAPDESSLPLSPPGGAPGAATDAPATPEGEAPAPEGGNSDAVEETTAPETAPSAETPAEPAAPEGDAAETPAPEAPAPESSETPAP